MLKLVKIICYSFKQSLTTCPHAQTLNLHKQILHLPLPTFHIPADAIETDIGTYLASYDQINLIIDKWFFM